MPLKKYDSKYDNITLYIIISKSLENSQVLRYMETDSYNKLYQNYKRDKDTNMNTVKAWTDSKQLAKFYIDFHNCNEFEAIQVDGTLEELADIQTDNIHDEIKIMNIRIKDPDNPKKEKIIKIPMTDEEHDTIHSDEETWSSSRIDYGELEKYYFRLKDKYKRIFDNILLTDVIMKVQHAEDSKYLKKIKQDQLALLYRLFPNSFD